MSHDVIAMETWGRGSWQRAVGSLMNSKESHNAMLPGWDYVTRDQAETSVCSPAHSLTSTETTDL